MQGGVKNYLGNQKEVKAPLNWQSGPDHPATELAYITKKEKDLLIKKDLHNSLKGGANRGPSGIMSLNGWGDKGEGMSDKSFGGNERPGTSTGRTNDAVGPHDGSTFSPTVNTMPDVVDQKYSGDGWFSGYRNLDKQGQPKMGLSYLGDRLKGFLPGLIGNFIAPGVGTAFNVAKNIPNIKNFKNYDTLSGFYKGELSPDEEEEEVTSDYSIGPDGKYGYTGPELDYAKEFQRNHPLDLSNRVVTNNGIVNTNAFNDSNANNMSVEELNSWVGGS